MDPPPYASGGGGHWTPAMEISPSQSDAESYEEEKEEPKPRGMNMLLAPRSYSSSEGEDGGNSSSTARAPSAEEEEEDMSAASAVLAIASQSKSQQKARARRSHSMDDLELSIERKLAEMDMPLVDGPITVMALGSVVPEEHFYTSKKLFPIGYETVVRAMVTKPVTVAFRLRCKIVQGNKKNSPIFVVELEKSAAEIVFRSYVASKAWKKALVHFESLPADDLMAVQQQEKEQREADKRSVREAARKLLEIEMKAQEDAKEAQRRAKEERKNAIIEAKMEAARQKEARKEALRQAREEEKRMREQEKEMKRALREEEKRKKIEEKEISMKRRIEELRHGFVEEERERRRQIHCLKLTTLPSLGVFVSMMTLSDGSSPVGDGDLDDDSPLRQKLHRRGTNLLKGIQFEEEKEEPEAVVLNLNGKKSVMLASEANSVSATSREYYGVVLARGVLSKIMVGEKDDHLIVTELVVSGNISTENGKPKDTAKEMADDNGDMIRVGDYLMFINGQDVREMSLEDFNSLVGKLPSPHGLLMSSVAPVVKNPMKHIATTQGASKIKCCGFVLKLLRAKEIASPFNQPVDAELYPDYYSSGDITEPMDLGTIAEKIEDEDYENDDVDSFVDDVQLAEISNLAQKLSKTNP
eukprot:jgi/Phyca11/16667/fgenesh1_pg.PHYCAscaffold_21_\